MMLVVVLVILGVVGPSYARDQQQIQLTPPVNRVLSPTEGLVRLALDELDTDGDGKVALAEVRDIVTRYFHLRRRPGPGGPRGSFQAELSGYFMTLARIADVDESLFLEVYELRRAAALLMRETSPIQVGRMVELASEVRWRLDNVNPRDIVVDVNIFDADGDGQVSYYEVQSFSSQRRFRFHKDALQTVFQTSDVDGDGQLNTAEAVEWITEVTRQIPFLKLSLDIYRRVQALVGRDIANAWAETR